MRRSYLPLALLPLAAPAAAQYGNEWVTYVQDGSMLDAGTISSGSMETDLAWTDANQDGHVDLAVVRKQPFTSPGKRTNLFLRNEGGVLRDRTAEVASASDVPGDQGFQTATNDRDVIFVDVDGDGWEDMVTATTLSDGDPKHIGHPRLYRNLGKPAGTWLGFQHQNARMPTLLHFGSGQMQNPRFCSVAGGDLTDNGFADLYFGDYDSSGAGGVQQGANEDMNDRLLINDGSGFFADESQARMTSDMLLSAFGMATEIHDMNVDGQLDVIKDTALNPPQDVRVIYNDDQNPGMFSIQDKFHTGFAPYHIDVNDLNNDGRHDIVVSDDAADRYRYNLGNDGLGRVIWGPSKTFQFLNGGDDGFGSNNLIADLDHDGWRDALICDVDVDISGYNRRLHIYRNPGGDETHAGSQVGAQITLVEEREQGGGNGWLGAVGLHDNDLEGTHDVGVFDVDGDGDRDLIISRYNGTFAWRNELTHPGEYCQEDIGSAGPGTATLELCGDPLRPGAQADLRLNKGPANAPAWIVVGLQNAPLSILGGQLVPSDLALIVSGATDATGKWVQVVDGGTADSPKIVYMQGVTLDAGQPEGFGFTNALEVYLLPF